MNTRAGTMIHPLRVVSLIAGLMTWWSVPLAWAQQPHVGKFYEQGVNAYFAGRLGVAEGLLSEFLQANSQDPRAYYFRALCLLRQGRLDEARGDMLTGAMFEAQAPQRYAVGAALERVQGGNRLTLERYRRAARRDGLVQVSGISIEPAVPLTSPATFAPPEPDTAVIRQHTMVPLEELLRPEGPRAIADEAPPTHEPVPPQQPGSSTKASPVAPRPAPPSVAPPKTGNPFADDTAEAPGVAPAAPSAIPAQPPQPVPPQPAPPPATPPNTPPAEVEENPFGSS